jgi:hypothetical protein
MVLDKKVKIKITRKNIDHYKKFYENISLKDEIEIDTEFQLQKGSNLKVNVICDLCSVQRYIKYQAYVKNINSCEKYPIYTCDKCSHIKLKEYNLNNYGVEYYSQHPDRNEKVKSTSLEKYGAEHFSQSIYFKPKVSKTNLEKFGFENPFMDVMKIKTKFKEVWGVNHPSQVESLKEKIRETNEKRGHWMNRSSGFIEYRGKVRYLTLMNVSKLEWTGFDFYDGEYIKDNFNLHYNDPNYPTIDHKISIFDGFRLGMSVEEISDINNLCWTKRKINSTKSKKSI